MMARPVLLYVAGAPPESVAAEHGDFTDWFRALAAERPVDLEVCDGPAGERPPGARDLAGVVITGSPASLTAPEPWMEEAIALVRDAAEEGTPVLGVCFGHQVIGAAFGASVIGNPAGWEMGTHEIRTTERGERDPLFRGLPSPCAFNFSHQDIVDANSVSARAGLEILAENDRAAVQAIAAGDAIRGVQFHPEFSKPIAKAYLRARRDVIAADATARGAPEDGPERMLERARETPHGPRVFEQFLDAFVLKS